MISRYMYVKIGADGGKGASASNIYTHYSFRTVRNRLIYFNCGEGAANFKL